MEKILQFLKEYIDETASYRDFNTEAKRHFPLQMAGAYDYSVFNVMEEQFIIIRPLEDATISRLQKTMRLIEDETGMEVAAALDEVTPYALKKMLREKTAFIVAGKQLSLPFLALRIKNERRSIRKNIKKFSPGTQQVYLYLLYSKEEDFEIDLVMTKLSISRMTAVRGLSDLSDLGLLSFDVTGQTGRKKIYHKIGAKDFYGEGRKYLDDPVRETVYIRSLPGKHNLTKTDLTALSEMTMLAEPPQMRYAICSRYRKYIEELIIDKADALENNLPMVKLTKYDTGILGKNGCADPISIMLGIEEKDDRVEMALDELLGQYDWYEKEETEW